MNTINDVIRSFRKTEKEACVYKDGFRDYRWSYKELYERILKTIHLLDKKGVRKGDKVMIWAPNSPEWVICHLAIIGRGAISVPVDLMSNNIESLAEHCKPKLIIKTIFKRKVEYDAETILIEKMDKTLDKKGRIREASEEDLVNIVYTSGTTGDPKGVKLTHKNIMSNITSVTTHIHFGRKDKFLSLLPLSHMFEQTCGMMGPLYAGSSIVYLHSLKPSAIFKGLEEEDITIMPTVPRILQALRKGILTKVRSTWLGYAYSLLFRANIPMKRWIHARIHHKIGNKFRFFVSGGSALDPLTERFWNNLGFKVIQGYGLTECSPILTANLEEDYRFQSAGKPIPGVKMKTENGEVMAKGENIFPGYYKDKKLTNSSFSNGWYRTGDVGHFKDGYLYIKSRKKDVIVTKAGVNVYPEDIEPVINSYEGIKEASIIGMGDNTGENVHAVIVPEEGYNIDEIVEEVNEELNPSQKIRDFTIWPEDDLPKTSTLKVKKGLLKEKIKKKDVRKRRGGKFSKIVKMLAEISPLTIEQIRQDHKIYSDLKIDSIGRVELVSRIEREFNFDFEEEMITEKTTVNDLEEMVKEKKKGKQKVKYPKWTEKRWVRKLRKCFLKHVNLKLPLKYMDITVKGKDNLKGVRGPVIFVSNHQSFFDHPAILSSLPERFRYNTSAPAKWEVFFERPTGILNKLKMRFWYIYVISTMGLYVMPEHHSYKKSLEYTGRRINQGENILIFPEGARTTTDKLLPFRKGSSVIIQKLNIPVVPIGIDGLVEIFPRTVKKPIKKGPVKVNIGKPIRFRDESLNEIMKTIRKEIDRLRKQ
ncbi:MAG: AMP-binding protein [Nanobdellota archaeon]